MVCTKNRLIGLVGAVLMASTALGAYPAMAEPKTALKGNVAQWLKDAKRSGDADEKKQVQISIYLNFRNADQLKQLAKNVNLPGAREYEHYLTPAQFHQKFSPSAADIAKIKAFLSASGFKVENTAASGVFVNATGSVAKIKSTFDVSQSMYSYKGKLLRANAEEPTLPRSLIGTVAFVAGLDETGLLKRPNIHTANDASDDPQYHAMVSAALQHGKAISDASPAAPPPPAAGIPLSHCSTYYGDTTAEVEPAPAPYAKTEPYAVCGYTPQQIQAAYGADKTGLDGKGVIVAITDAFASPTIQKDANTYSARHGLPKLTSKNFTQAVPPGVFGLPANYLLTECGGPQGWYGEETLDVEAVHSMAPGASILYVGAADCANALSQSLYNAIDGVYLGGHVPNVITNSWSYTGEPSLNEEAVQDAGFLQGVVEGITISFSSGDKGDIALDTGISQGSYPATSPYVSAIGGTSLALYDHTGFKQEWGWGTFRSYLSKPVITVSGDTIANTGLAGFSFYSGSGGGPSLTHYQPRYQRGVVPSFLSTSTFALGFSGIITIPFTAPHRVTPDISLDADPYTGFLIGESYTPAGNPTMDNGCTPNGTNSEYCEGGTGGTSLASPLFAGLIAQVDQARLQNGLATLGLANPSLYRLPRGGPDEFDHAILDVDAPVNPEAVLRGYLNDNTRIRLVTINSAPNGTVVGPLSYDCSPATLCQGVDAAFLQTTSGYDNVTGIGTPNLPVLVKKLSKH